MNPTDLDPLLVGGLVVVALAGVGVVAAFGAGARAGHRVARQAREVTRMGATLGRALACGAVVVGVQWAVLVCTTDVWAWAVVLGVPAVLAGSAVARLFAVTEIVHGHRGRGGRR